MGTLSVRIHHCKEGKSKGQRHHDMRTSTHIPNYVDKSKSIINSVIIAPASETVLRDICLTRRGIRDIRKLGINSNISTRGIITFSHDAQKIIESLPIEEQDQRFLEAAKAIAKELNSTLTGLVVHRDETALHAHFQIPAYDLNGNPLSKTIKPLTTAKLQDIASASYIDIGITRGKPKADRIRDGDHLNQIYNRSVQQLHEDLPREIETLQRQAFEYYEKAKKNYAYLEKSQALARNASSNNEKIQKRIVAYERREKEAIAAAESAEKEIEQKLKILEVLEKNEKLQDQIVRLTAENQKLKAMVTQQTVKRLKAV
jgi:L-fucose mutarotase/ribose pyranase (RbsD/FucU family)